jgi:hypothetical protein
MTMFSVESHQKQFVDLRGEIHSIHPTPQMSIKAIDRIRTLDCFHPAHLFFLPECCCYYKPIWAAPVSSHYTALDLRNVPPPDVGDAE